MLILSSHGGYKIESAYRRRSVKMKPDTAERRQQQQQQLEVAAASDAASDTGAPASRDNCNVCLVALSNARLSRVATRNSAIHVLTG